MFDNIVFARELLAPMSSQQFFASRVHFYAATRALEIVSEAIRRLPEELRARHPQIPWRAIRDSGNIYRHRYDLVDESLVWDTVQWRLPVLQEAVESELRKFDQTRGADSSDRRRLLARARALAGVLEL